MINLKGVSRMAFYIIFCLGVIALLSLIISYFLERWGWTISLGLAHIVFLIIIRAIPIEKLIELQKIEDYWKKEKDLNKPFILSNCTTKKDGEKIILYGCIKDIYSPDMESVTKASFILKDTKSFITSFRNEITFFILCSAFLLLGTCFATVELSDLDYSDSKQILEPEARRLVADLKSRLSLAGLIISILVQLAFLLKTPFWLDSRSRTYVIENNCD